MRIWWSTVETFMLLYTFSRSWSPRLSITS